MPSCSLSLPFRLLSVNSRSMPKAFAPSAARTSRPRSKPSLVSSPLSPTLNASTIPPRTIAFEQSGQAAQVKQFFMNQRRNGNPFALFGLAQYRNLHDQPADASQSASDCIAELSDYLPIAPCPIAQLLCSPPHPIRHTDRSACLHHLGPARIA